MIPEFTCLSKISLIQKFTNAFPKNFKKSKGIYKKSRNDKEKFQKLNLTQVSQIGEEYDDYSYENLEIHLPYFASGLTSFLYLAKNKKGKDLVVKVFNTDCIEDYSNEMEVIGKLKKSDNLIKVYYNGKIWKKNDPNFNKFYIVFEYAEKGDLANLLEEKGKLTEIEARDYIIQIIRAIEDLQSSGFIHRDIKPENILLMNDNTIKLTDFGFCDEIKNFDIGPYGTPGYIPPELYNKRNVIPEKVDMYSLGIMSFTLVTGKFPFRTTNEEDYIYNLVSKGNWKKFWSLLRKNLSKEFKNMIENLLCFNPEKRYNIKQLKNCSFIKNSKEIY